MSKINQKRFLLVINEIGKYSDITKKDTKTAQMFSSNTDVKVILMPCRIINTLSYKKSHATIHTSFIHWMWNHFCKLWCILCGWNQNAFNLKNYWAYI